MPSSPLIQAARRGPRGLGVLGARVIGELGVSTQLLAPGDIYLALETGTIDATEFSTPAAAASLGFPDDYYLPGWHQQSAFAQILINLNAWNGLSEAHRSAIAQATTGSCSSPRTRAAGGTSSSSASPGIRTRSPLPLDLRDLGRFQDIQEVGQRSTAPSTSTARRTSSARARRSPPTRS
jgi:hypothetical protein